ncbi:hypothetical protein GCM10009558_055080 [Virgisporangium aurantiacum]
MTVSMAASGCLFGLAYGDALGKPTEFLSVAEIRRRYGDGGPRELTGDPALVTDDTQMTIAVGRALLDVSGPPAPAVPEPLLRARFLEWAASPENNRAPGMTCLRACGELARGVPWVRATVVGSKGCGANMRVAPVGLVAGYDVDTLAGVALYELDRRQYDAVDSANWREWLAATGRSAHVDGAALRRSLAYLARRPGSRFLEGL